MPHYTDGSEAKIGDVVKGKGYNIKGEEGKLKEIVGTLIHITPGATTCNVQVAVVELAELDFGEVPSWPALMVLQREGVKFVSKADAPREYTLASIKIEYGQADHFTKVLDG